MTAAGVDESFTGRVYPPTSAVHVTADAVRAFARAVRAEHPAHHDASAARALGHRDVVAPPTFAVTLAQRADAQFVEDPAAGIDFSRVVHGEQSFVHHRPVVAGDELTAELHVDRVRVVRGNAMVTTRSELRTTAGEAVCTAVSTLVVRAPEDS